VSFQKIIQLPVKGSELAEIVVVTHKTSQKDYEEILQQLRDLPIVENVKSSYRVEGVGTV
jgi:homoserine dehydrogenase